LINSLISSPTTAKAEEYALSADWENRWRTGGTVAELLEEAHFSPKWLLDGIERFVRARDVRLGRLQAETNAVRGQNPTTDYAKKGKGGDHETDS
jgi:hypothetical protein